MKSMDTYSSLKSLGYKVFRTADAAATLSSKIDATSKTLERITRAGLLVKLKRGLWAFPETDPYSIPEYLTAPNPSYISLQSALYLNGMISQIPESIYAVSISRAKRFDTKLGTFSLHKIQASLFCGYNSKGPQGVKIATPEKALIDYLYFNPAKSKLFSDIPELSFPKNFNLKSANALIQKIPSKRRSLIERLFLELIQKYTKNNST